METMVSTEEMTFDEFVHILNRLHYWSRHLHREAEFWAVDTPLETLTKGLKEKRIVGIDENFLAMVEKVLLYERDPVKLWRFAMGLQNHKFGLLAKVEELFPQKKDRLKYFKVRW